MTYRPLPTSVTVSESEIEGLGLFAVEDIADGTSLGVSHVFIPDSPDFEDRIIRTPLGGFINHSDDPNCVKITQPRSGRKGIRWVIHASRDIVSGEELTVEYSLYDPRS